MPLFPDSNWSIWKYMLDHRPVAVANSGELVINSAPFHLRQHHKNKADDSHVRLYSNIASVGFRVDCTYTGKSVRLPV